MVCGSPVLAGAQARDRDTADTVFVAALRGPTGVVLAQALVDGPSSTDAAEYRYEVVPDPPTMVARLASGDVDIGMLPANVAAQLVNRGVPVQIAAVTLWGLLYVVGPADAGSGWDAIGGAGVQAVGQGATPDILVRHLAEQAGAAFDLQFRYAPVELAQLVIAGRYDYALLPEPFVTQVLTARTDLAVIVDLQQEWRAMYGRSYPQTVVVVRSDLVAANRAAVDEVLAEIRAGTESASEDPPRIAQLVGRTVLGIPPAVVRTALQRFNAEFVPAREARDALDAFFGILAAVEPRSIGGAVPGDAAYY